MTRRNKDRTGFGSGGSGGSGAPTTADYLTGTAQAGLSAEIVVGATPGGELGNTWASPTVDTVHSGSSHAATQAAAEATAAAALAAYEATAPLDTLVARHGGEYVGKRALDKWRYGITPKTVVILGDSLVEGDTGAFDSWPERFARDIGNWTGPRLTAGAGYYPLYRSGGQVFGLIVGDREWFIQGAWSNSFSGNSAPYAAGLQITAANGTDVRTVTDGTTTVNSTGISSPTIAFVAGDVGSLIVGTNIPPNTRITAVTNATTAAISNRATASTAGTCSFSIQGATLTWTRNLGQTQAARVMNDLTTTNASTTITCPTANFRAYDVGRLITATNLPANTTITVVTDYQTATVSAAATASGVGGRCIIHEGRNVTDLATTNASATITSATAAFTAFDVDSKVIGTNIPSGTSILSVESATSATLSANATATGSALPLFINAYKAQRHVVDMVCGNTTTITSATAAFTKRDVGKHVTGANIPNNTTITATSSSTSVTISNAATAAAGTNTIGTLSIGSTSPTSISHLEVLWFNGIASNGASFGYSTDGGATWTSVAQTTTGGPYLTSVLITIANPTTLIIRANVGTSVTVAAKSQTNQAGLNAYQSDPTGAGVKIFNAGCDGNTFTELMKYPPHFFASGLGGVTTSATVQPWPGWRPDLVIVLFTNDRATLDQTRYINSLNRLIDRVESYADIIILGAAQTSGETLANVTNFAAATKSRMLSSAATSWGVTDGVTNSNTTITSATINFVATDVGRTITGTDIPGGTTITAVASLTSATISQAATGSHSGCTFTIAGVTPDTQGAFIDLYEAWGAEGESGYTAANAAGLMFDTVHPSQVGHNDICGRVSRLVRVFS